MFLLVNDMIRLYEGVRSVDWCYRTYRLIKAANAMNRPNQIITVRQFCDYMELDYNEIIVQLGWSPAGDAGRILRKAA